MKSILLFSLFVTLSFSTKVQAQLQVDPPSTASNAEYNTPEAKSISQLYLAIKPDSYLKTFLKEKKGFLNKAENTAGAKDLVQNIITLSKSIKPDKFKSGVNADVLIKNAGSITAMKQAFDLLRSFEEGLKPIALVPIWNLQRNGWLKELNN